MPEAARRRSTSGDTELGDFLRARRALVPPELAGLPDDTVRRVPGLRREEVALLSGVSTDYYVRLEQGRERHPSKQVLLAVARALHLDDDATAHLLRIGFPELLPSTGPVTQVAPELRLLMDRMAGVPAFVVGPGQDVLAANALAERAARTAVRNLRASSTTATERTEQVVGRLSLRSPVFAELWASHDVGPRTSEDKRFRHPEVGELLLHFESLAVASAPGQHLSVYTAAPGSEEALARLAALALDDP